jgi:cytochrome b561
MKRRAMALAGLSLMWMGWVSAAAPKTYTVQSGSSLTFQGTQQGEKFSGAFKNFDATIKMDDSASNASLFDVTIHLKSTDSKNAERDAALMSASWFDVAHHPDAHFKTVGFRSTPQGTVADADLTIRDKTKRIVFPYVFKKTPTGATLDATVRLNRLDYGLGAGEWADDSMVGHAVDVLVHLTLSSPSADPAHR